MGLMSNSSRFHSHSVHLLSFPDLGIFSPHSNQTSFPHSSHTYRYHSSDLRYRFNKLSMYQHRRWLPTYSPNRWDRNCSWHIEVVWELQRILEGWFNALSEGGCHGMNWTESRRDEGSSGIGKLGLNACGLAAHLSFL